MIVVFFCLLGPHGGFCLVVQSVVPSQGEDLGSHMMIVLFLKTNSNPEPVFCHSMKSQSHGTRFYDLFRSSVMK